MSSILTCAAYSDVDATIRLDGRVVYLALEDAGKHSSIHLTLNLSQVRIFAKYLSVALEQINFADLRDEKHFGDLVVNIEQADCDELAAAS